MTFQEAKRSRTGYNETKNYTEEEMKDIFRWCFGNTQITKPLKPSKQENLPLLHYAIEKGYKFLLDVMLEKEVLDVDTIGPKGESPLMMAIRKGNTEIASLLIQKGANVFTN